MMFVDNILHWKVLHAINSEVATLTVGAPAVKSQVEQE